MYPPLMAISPVLSCPPTTSKIRTFLMTRSAGQWPSACRIRSASCSGVGGFRGRDTAGSARRERRGISANRSIPFCALASSFAFRCLFLKNRETYSRCSQDTTFIIALFANLYELTMLQAYVEVGMQEQATFSLFTRRLPKRRNYLLACGLDDVLSYLESLRFDEESLEYLASLGRFKDSFLAWLRDFRFTGDVHAVLEGTPVFANEPILEITAPIVEAQLAETFIVNQIHLQTTLASKAARVVTAARGRAVVDFGARRIHGTDAAIQAARAFYVAGVAATSNVLAGKIYGLPVTGTMAHSFVQAWDDEKDAFRSFVRFYPDTVLLVDTYDTAKGVGRVCELSEALGDQFKVRAVCLDSGDLATLAWRTREILDAAGLGKVEIFASSGLDEDVIDDLVTRGAPIMGFGVGTKMGVSEDAPSLDIAYKLCAYANMLIKPEATA